VSQPTFQYQALASTPNLEPGVSPTPEPFVFFLEPSRRPPRTKQNFSWLSEPRAIFPPSDPTSPHAGQMMSIVPRDPYSDSRTRDHQDIVSEMLNSLTGGGYIYRDDVRSWKIFAPAVKTANSAPTANDDIDDGNGVGLHWIDQTSNNVYICVDASAGAAVWVQLN
jgi:hypothetical protein